MASPRSGLAEHKFRRLKKCGLFLLPLLLYILLLLVFCEFLIYYLVMHRCTWPEVTTAPERDHKLSPQSVLKAIFLSDTHLLGEITGHWWDKLRREWQMERAFQTALWLLQPDIVFILGDVFDEGKWSSPTAWADDVARFRSMFRHAQNTELVAIAGNHDIGFHYDMNKYKLKRFENVFNFKYGKIISREGINFVLVNSVTLEGDGCSICKSAEAALHELSLILNCSRKHNPQGATTECKKAANVPPSAPILLQHYPLYRRSDSDCSGEDSATPEEKNIPFKEKYDVLSQEASQKIMFIHLHNTFLHHQRTFPLPVSKTPASVTS
ncbi:metallophosphoesterase 1 isoform X2 [Pleurodeles waltl]|uniref:metallophosphoesterase 1 isoform X2 n=1 Tax=Pleurodeles waltl TaxID=8319 RepID=UPI0037094ECD